MLCPLLAGSVMTQTQCIYILCYLWGSLALEYKAWEGKGKREEERKLCTWERTVMEGGEGRQNSSQARAVTLGAKRRRVELDPDETLLSLTPGSVDDQVPSEDGCSSAISSEDDVASVTDDLEQDDEAETAPPVVISSDNAPRAASLHRGSEPVEWVKTLLNKLRAHRWPVPRIVLYWLGLQGGGRGLRQTKKADKLANVLLEQEDFFSAVTRHPKIQRWAVENHVPEVVTHELDQLRASSKIFGKFDPDTSATDI